MSHPVSRKQAGAVRIPARFLWSISKMGHAAPTQTAPPIFHFELDGELFSTAMDTRVKNV
ncbi:hypothetical protein DAKH74_042590 [Maudiozyma humilis]|uniref:Uncharacterized protein n=1 Tax=Maudiozyma humilis TaxID=51915 RepID=A0AAV5S449_MAUHU|nr:hypothetical protein DAKH74_042590 [Kazachstania humilis]